MKATDLNYRPSVFQALKMHLIAAALGVLLVGVWAGFQLFLDGAWEGLEEAGPWYIATIPLLLVFLIVFSIDFAKFRKRSPDEIVLSPHLFQVGYPSGRRFESRWEEVESAKSNDLTWTVCARSGEVAFSVAGLRFREQKELAEAISSSVEAHRA